MRLHIIPTLLITLIAATQPASAVDVYLHDLLNRPTYSALYKQMLARGGRLPSWLKGGSESRNTLQLPAKDMKAGTLTYTVAYMCWKPTCPGEQLLVVFDPNEQAAWGRLTVGEQTRWIGNPPPEVRTAAEELEF